MVFLHFFHFYLMFCKIDDIKIIKILYQTTWYIAFCLGIKLEERLVLYVIKTTEICSSKVISKNK